jgi:prepilin-type N-terminal cleavage/methylation domain-containing protein
MNRKAFTLVELLVVIAIIGLLSTVAVVSMSGARSKARDAKWVADKNQVIKALNLYYSDHDAWPLTGGAWVCIGAPASETCWNGSHAGDDAINAAMTPYMANFPKTNADAGTLAYNRYVYASGSLAGQTGAFLVWPKASTMTASECNSAYPPQHEDSYWYCYEYLGP